MNEEGNGWGHLVEALPHVVWTASAEGVVDYFSARFSTFTGVAASALLGWGWLDVLHPAERAGAQDAWLRLVDAGHDLEIERRFCRADGTYQSLACHGRPVRDSGGKVIRWVGTWVDVTERQRVEQQLVENEERWRDFLETLPQFVFTSGPDGAVDYFSSRLMEYTGKTLSELLGAGWASVIHPDDLGYTAKIWSESVEKQRPHELQHRIRASDGSYRWFTTRAELIRDRDGRVYKWLGTSTDITNFKDLEAELRQVNERLEVAIRSSNLSIWEYEFPDGLIQNARERLTNVWEPLGYDLASAPAAAALILHPDERERTAREVFEYLSGETPTFQQEHRALHRDGSYRWLLGRGVALRDPDDPSKVTRFVGTSVDITEMKRIEEDLQHARESADAANQAKDAFLANVSHEIRTPMNAILGMTELALDHSQHDDQKRLLSTVRSAARSLLGILDELLDFSKVTAGKIELDKSNFRLRQEVSDVMGLLLVRSQRKGIELRCDVHPDVPDLLYGDAGRIRQVLMNLVGNALKFTARGSVVVEVTATADALNDVTVAFTIRDTGIGIARDKQAAIFRAFEQADASTTRRYGGTGLGLTISLQLAALMGGTITVESELGFGSTFTFTARLERVSRTDATHGWVTGQAASRVASTSSLRILVAEDNEFNIALLKPLLSKRGHRAEFAEDGVTALRLVSESKFDLVLLDLHMPELDGFDVVRRIRENEATTGEHLPIIALTARSSSRDRDRCLAAGMDDFLTKPIDAEKLWIALERVSSMSSSSTRSPRILDDGLILRACAGDARTFDQLCVVFRETLPDQLLVVRTALQERDLVRLAAATIRLHGTVATFSRSAGELALAIEDAATRDDLESSTDLVLQLDAVCMALLEDLRGIRISDLRA